MQVLTIKFKTKINKLKKKNHTMLLVRVKWNILCYYTYEGILVYAFKNIYGNYDSYKQSYLGML